MADAEVDLFKTEKFEQIRNSECIVIEKIGPDFVVHHWTENSVMPISVYKTARLAASRTLQLLHIGPVAPQDHPETIGIGYVMANES
jgi:hypothetical protein